MHIDDRSPAERVRMPYRLLGCSRTRCAGASQSFLFNSKPVSVSFHRSTGVRLASHRVNCCAYSCISRIYSVFLYVIVRVIYLTVNVTPFPSSLIPRVPAYPSSRSEPANSRSTARQKLTRLTRQQFQELSTDVYDELLRRKNNSTSNEG